MNSGLKSHRRRALKNETHALCTVECIDEIERACVRKIPNTLESIL